MIHSGSRNRTVTPRPHRLGPTTCLSGLRTVEPTGITVVDKPAGMTSHDVVARMRRIAGIRRVGHGGTLDPMATGVLVLALGRATRLLTYVAGTDKAYQATIRLGQATVTDDAEGEVISSADASFVTAEMVQSELAALTGEIDQVPSAVSAVKVAGRRAYARVRSGEQVELAARRVTVHRFELRDLRHPASGLVDCDVEVECSSGTYVRALARDLGAALGVGGHLTALRRTRVGSFTLDDAVTLQELQNREDPVVLPLAQTVRRCFPTRSVDHQDAVALAYGKPLSAVGIAGAYAVFSPEGEVIGIVREQQGLARPEVVLAPAGGGK